MRALEFITGHVIYKPAYTYKFQLKTTLQILINHGSVVERICSKIIGSNFDWPNFFVPGSIISF